jgi:hypothetical protein
MPDELAHRWEGAPRVFMWTTTRRRRRMLIHEQQEEEEEEGTPVKARHMKQNQAKATAFRLASRDTT